MEVAPSVRRFHVRRSGHQLLLLAVTWLLVHFFRVPSVAPAADFLTTKQHVSACTLLDDSSSAGSEEDIDHHVSHTPVVSGGEKPPEVLSAAMSCVVMGGLAFQMLLLHFVQHHDPAVQGVAKDVLNDTVSIFCAVLFYTRMTSVIQQVTYLLASSQGHLHQLWTRLGSWGDIAVLALFAAALYVLMHILTLKYVLTRRPKVALACAQLLSHCGGFAALYVVTGTQLHIYHNYINKHGAHPIILVVSTTLGAALFLSLIAFVCEGLRLRHMNVLSEKYGNDLRVSWSLREHYMTGVREAEANVMSFSVGFLIVQVMGYIILSDIEEFHPPHPPTRVIEVGQSAPDRLRHCCVVLLLALVSAQKLLQAGSHHLPKRLEWYIEMVVIRVTAMGLAWGVVRWTDWQFYCLVHKSFPRILALVFQALFVSAFSFACIVLVIRLAGHGSSKVGAMRTLIEVLGLQVGIVWEKCFDVAIEDIAAAAPYYANIDGLTASRAVTCLLLLVVLPCWYENLFPRPADGLKEPL